MNKQSLLEVAKSAPIKRFNKIIVSKEDIELAVAWARSEITTEQVSHAKGFKKQNGSTYNYLLRCLKNYVSTQKIK